MDGPLKQSIFAIIVGVVSLGFVFEMLRRRRLREKYAVLWMVIGAAALVLAVWPKLLSALAGAVGINTPSNLLFFASLAISFFVALQLSSEVGLLEEESRTLAEEVGLLRLQVSELSVRVDAQVTGEGTPTPLPPEDQSADVVGSAEARSDQAAEHAPPDP